MTSKRQPTKGRRKSKQRSELLEQLYQEWLVRTLPTDRFTVTTNPNEKESPNDSELQSRNS